MLNVQVLALQTKVYPRAILELRVERLRSTHLRKFALLTQPLQFGDRIAHRSSGSTNGIRLRQGFPSHLISSN
ncbi:MAG: hypothetical protein MUC48_00675 [Leptolyngbya sp. Prado105]|nr:hypothetical protein [Leptolyngbya sp. Prado105]